MVVTDVPATEFGRLTRRCRCRFCGTVVVLTVHEPQVQASWSRGQPLAPFAASPLDTPERVFVGHPLRPPEPARPFGHAPEAPGTGVPERTAATAPAAKPPTPPPGQ